MRQGRSDLSCGYVAKGPAVGLCRRCPNTLLGLLLIAGVSGLAARALIGLWRTLVYFARSCRGGGVMRRLWPARGRSGGLIVRGARPYDWGCAHLTQGGKAMSQHNANFELRTISGLSDLMIRSGRCM